VVAAVQTLARADPGSPLDLTVDLAVDRADDPNLDVPTGGRP